MYRSYTGQNFVASVSVNFKFAATSCLRIERISLRINSMSRAVAFWSGVAAWDCAEACAGVVTPVSVAVPPADAAPCNRQIPATNTPANMNFFTGVLLFSGNRVQCVAAGNRKIVKLPQVEILVGFRLHPWQSTSAKGCLTPRAAQPRPAETLCGGYHTFAKSELRRTTPFQRATASAFCGQSRNNGP